MVSNLSTATVPPELDGSRLDGALSLFLPEAGMRIRKRLFETHTILVNGVPRSKGHTVSTGDQILLVEKTESEQPSDNTQDSATLNTELTKKLYIVHEDAHFAAIYKPGGLHTAAIAGKNTPSLEAELRSLFAKDIAADEVLPVLLNRLDCLTSGMVMAAKSKAAAAMFKELENAGAVEKLYLLLVHGSVTAPLVVTNKLDTAKRKITKILPEPDSDPLRHTTFLPLLETTLPNDPSGSATLLMAAISKGARHQIRAHIASQGFPIVGDPLYGSAEEDVASPHEQTMYLHHYQIELGSFSAMCPPEWSMWEHWKGSIPAK
ncbi:pseudouridine synthase family protein [Halodesulfovibrio spirochaetisodalis]|uniref:pseudouridine synthase family protein n=1 Tax=Halodesulfovibrio spirochaetisodalis TaxID=1560234 RepID=UPI000831DAAC|nr:pseudouridine synthase [Halodesulfovibrio spirochaetisodalis]